MFDQQEYTEKRGSYLDLDKDLYGYRSPTVEDVYNTLTYMVENNITHNEWYGKADEYIDYFDQDNCKRLAQRVMNV